MDFAVAASILGAYQDNTFRLDMSLEPESPEGSIDQPGKSTGQSWRYLGPTPEQWADIKDTFTQLYIVENRKLREVQEILSRDGFHASEKMFKRRITQWKICKNYKARQKEMLAQRVKACVDAGHDVQSMSFQGRPVKLDRVKRHFRSDKRYMDLWERLSHSPDAISVGDAAIKEDSPSIGIPRSTPGQTSDPSPPDQSDSSMTDSDPASLGALTVNIRPPTDMYNMQSTLFHTREAVAWQFTSFRALKMKELNTRFPDSIPEEVRAGQVDQASAFWLGLYHGFNHLGTGRSQEAWTTFDNCCKLVLPMIHSTPLQLLSCLMVHFATPWQNMKDLEQHLLGFISSMAANALGVSHPLATTLRMMAKADIREQVLESMMMLVLEGYTSRRKPDNSSLFALRVDQIDMLRKRRNFQPAQSLCQALIRDSETMKPKRYRTALAALGRLYADQEEEFAVEGVAHRILQHETADAGSTNSSTAAWACDQLATLCMRRGDYRLAEQYLRRAAYMSYTRLLHRGPSTESFVKRLDDCMRRQGKEVGVEKVFEELGIETNYATT